MRNILFYNYNTPENQPHNITQNKEFQTRFFIYQFCVSIEKEYTKVYLVNLDINMYKKMEKVNKFPIIMGHYYLVYTLITAPQCLLYQFLPMESNIQFKISLIPYYLLCPKKYSYSSFDWSTNWIYIGNDHLWLTVSSGFWMLETNYPQPVALDYNLEGVKLTLSTVVCHTSIIPIWLVLLIAYFYFDFSFVIKHPFKHVFNFLLSFTHSYKTRTHAHTDTHT